MVCHVFNVTTIVVVLASVAIADEQVDFTSQIQPIFIEHCAKCHGEKLGQGKMRLHTAEAVREKWDADEHFLVSGDPDSSELYQRLVLPADDKKRMPKNADPLPKEGIELIAKWIEQGAVLPTAATGGESTEATTAVEPSEVTPPAEKKLPEVAPASQEAIDRLVDAGAQVTLLYSGSPLLDVSFVQRSEPAGDADVMLLAGVAHQVHSLNLADAQVSEVGLALLAALKNLSRLHLERSTVSDAGLAHLSGLEQLEYLNLYGTGVSDAGISQLAGLAHLRKLYVWQTKVSYDAAQALEAKIPGLIVNLGSDHPVIVRQRLTKELELAKKQRAEASADEEKAKRLLESAKQNQESLDARIAEIAKELSTLGEAAAARDDANTSSASKNE